MTTPFDLSVTDELLTTTRAVRRRLDLDRPVDPATVLECIAIAQQAPTGSNSQTWRWLVVTEPATKTALADLYRSGCLAYLRRESEEEPDPQTRRVYQSALALAESIERVPVLVLPCVKPRAEGASAVVQASIWGSILPAAWSFLLALRARGLGSVWTTAHLGREAEAAELLGIPDRYMQVALFPVAHTIGTDFHPADRPPPESITYWETWGAGGDIGSN